MLTEMSIRQPLSKVTYSESNFLLESVKINTLLQKEAFDQLSYKQLDKMWEFIPKNMLIFSKPMSVTEQHVESDTYSECDYEWPYRSSKWVN